MDGARWEPLREAWRDGENIYNAPILGGHEGKSLLDCAAHRTGDGSSTAADG